MIRSISLQSGADIISALLGEILTNVVGKEVVLQVPVFASGRVGHIYVSAEEYDSFMKNPVVTEMIAWLDHHDVQADLMRDDRAEA